MGHWVFQIVILFSVIFLVVLRDSFKNQTNRNKTESVGLTQKQPVIQRKSRSFSDFSKKPSNLKPVKPVEIRSQALASIQIEEKKTVVTASATATTLNKKIKFKVTLINRKAIEDLMGKGQRLEENALIIETQYLRKITTQSTSELKTIGQILKTYQFNQETLLFVGDEDPETNLNLGFYLQITVFEESHPEGIHFEAQSWHQLKTNDEPSPRREWEVTMNNSSSLVIVSPEVHDMPFTREELLAFEYNLKLLGDENFQEEISDIILVVEVQ